MSVWTSTVMAKPPWVERPTSSASTTEARASRPDPPSASGTRSEKKPSPPISRSTSRGTKPASSHFGPVGLHLLLDEAAELGADQVVVFGEDRMCHARRDATLRRMSRDKRLQDRSIYPHWCTDTVRFSDQDAAGHINNVAICAYHGDRAPHLHARHGDDGAARGRRARHLRRHDRVASWPSRTGRARSSWAPACCRIGTSSLTVGSAAFKDDALHRRGRDDGRAAQGQDPHPIDGGLRTRPGKVSVEGF